METQKNASSKYVYAHLYIKIIAHAWMCVASVHDTFVQFYDVFITKAN